MMWIKSTCNELVWSLFVHVEHGYNGDKSNTMLNENLKYKLRSIFTNNILTVTFYKIFNFIKSIALATYSKRDHLIKRNFL